jgi:hypothetical protein
MTNTQKKWMCLAVDVALLSLALFGIHTGTLSPRMIRVCLFVPVSDLLLNVAAEN